MKVTISRGSMFFTSTTPTPRRKSARLLPMGRTEALNVTNYLVPGYLFKLQQQHRSDHVAVSALAALGHCQ